MNLGFDAKRYFHNFTGLGNYSRDLVDTLTSHFPDNKYFLFDKHPSTLELPANTIAVVPIAKRFLWRERGMVHDVKRFRLDVFHGLSNELPWGRWPSNTKKVVTMHDVIFRRFPTQYNWPDRMIYDKKTSHAVKIADAIICTSQATADDLTTYYQAKESKLKVVYQTCGVQHWKQYEDSEVQGFRNRHNLPGSFILYVSSFQERKNHIRLLEALHESNDKSTKIVVAGKMGNTFKTCTDYVKEKAMENQVRFINDLSAAELPLLYRCAQSFIYPSMIEGFGIPLLEAACAGLPIAANDIPVFREIAPSNSLFFDISNLKSMVSCISELKNLKTSNSLQHLERFKPEFAASTMMDIYKKL